MLVHDIHTLPAPNSSCKPNNLLFRGDEPLTSHELSPCELCSGEEVVEGALFRHRLEIEPAPVIAIVELTRVQLQVKHGTD